MTISTGKLRHNIHARAQQRNQRRNSLVLVLGLAVTLVLAGIVLFSLEASKPVDHQVSYDASRVVYGQTLHAVHEMTGDSLGSIPFLPADGPQPSIVIQESFFDFKRVGPTDVVSHEFVIANDGQADLTISRAYTSCDCTTADLTATVIPPGGIAIVTLTMDAGYHDVRGQTVRRGLIIENNDPDSPQMEIWVQAAVNGTP